MRLIRYTDDSTAFEALVFTSDKDADPTEFLADYLVTPGLQVEEREVDDELAFFVSEDDPYVR